MKRYIRSDTNEQAIIELRSYTDEYMTRRFIPELINFMSNKKCDITPGTALQLAEATDYVAYKLYAATGIEPNVIFGDLDLGFRGTYVDLSITLSQSEIDSLRRMSYQDKLTYGRVIFHDKITLEEIKKHESWDVKYKHILNIFSKSLKKSYKKYIEAAELVSPTQYALMYIDNTDMIHFVINHIADPAQFIQYCNNQLSRIYSSYNKNV